MPTGVYQRAGTFEQRSARARRVIARRMALGLHFGRPRKFAWEERRCKGCDVQFRFKAYPGKPPKIFCTRACHLTFQRDKRGKLPRDPKVLRDLYCTRGLSLNEIAALYDCTHSSVRRQLIRFGIARREAKPKRTTVCIETGCGAPVYRVRNAATGYAGGRRCHRHYLEHRRRLPSQEAKRMGWQRERLWAAIRRELGPMPAQGARVIGEMIERLEAAGALRITVAPRTPGSRAPASTARS